MLDVLDILEHLLIHHKQVVVTQVQHLEGVQLVEYPRSKLGQLVVCKREKLQAGEVVVSTSVEEM